MNKLFKLFMFLLIPFLSVMIVSCSDDDEIVTPPSPTITAVSPAEGLPGTVVTITGTNLQDVGSVRFGTTDAEGFNRANNTATSITATVPAGMEAGAQNIVITSPGGTDSFNFTVLQEQLPAPTITSFSPAEGAIGSQVTITGTNFVAENIESIMLGTVQVAQFTVAEDGNTIAFTVPEGAATGSITITPVDGGDPVVSTTQFTVVPAETPRTVVTHSDVVVNAQGVRNQEGKVTAFSADGETFTLMQGKDPEISPKIDFITADSGGDDEIDIFSPSHDSWLSGNYFEDADDKAVVWPTLNQTKMVLVEGMDAAAFAAATAAEINAMTIGDDFTTRLSTPDPGVVILFETADGQKGLLLWKAHDPNADAGSKADIFTFDIKVLE